MKVALIYERGSINGPLTLRRLFGILRQHNCGGIQTMLSLAEERVRDIVRR